MHAAIHVILDNFQRLDGGFRAGMMGGGLRGGIVGASVMRLSQGGFRGVSMRGGCVGSCSSALRPGFAPSFACFSFAFAELPFAVGVSLYGGSCRTWQSNPLGRAAALGL
jgi:hypothetical protein